MDTTDPKTPRQLMRTARRDYASKVNERRTAAGLPLLSHEEVAAGLAVFASEEKIEAAAAAAELP